MPKTDTESVPLEFAFSAAEYQMRMTRVRDAMKHAGLDILLVHEIANICYLTGYQTPLADWYHCLVLTVDNVEILQVCDTELAQMNTRVSNIVGVDWERMHDAAPVLVDILAEHGARKARIGIETRRPGLDAHTSECLRSQLTETHFIDASELVLQIRAVK